MDNKLESESIVGESHAGTGPGRIHHHLTEWWLALQG